MAPIFSRVPVVRAETPSWFEMFPFARSPHERVGQ